MVANAVSAVLTGNAGAIVTERDVVKAWPGISPALGLATADSRVTFESCPTIEALRIMLEHAVRNLIVVREPHTVPSTRDPQLVAHPKRPHDLPPPRAGRSLSPRDLVERRHRVAGAGEVDEAIDVTTGAELVVKEKRARLDQGSSTRS